MNQQQVSEISPIVQRGQLSLPAALIAVAEGVKHQNNRVNTPKRLQKHDMDDHAYNDLKSQIAGVLGVERGRVDFVYFACAQGADEHVDLLDPNVFTSRTVIVPVILPEGRTIFYAGDKSTILELGKAYEFNHERSHWMTVEDEQSGCVLVMASVKHGSSC